MSRAPDPLAPSRLPRQQRRRVEAALRKLMRPGTCSICGGSLKHNSRTAGGLDAQGNIALAGECCMSRMAEIFMRGFYSARNYDFLSPHGDPPESASQPTNAQIAEAIGLYQNVISETDKVLDHLVRRDGDLPITPKLNLRDSPWKSDDRDWFERNQKRSHRVRMPFPGEYDAEAAETPPGHVLIVLVRQVEPGSRLRPRFYLGNNLLPVPDDEAVAHALFEAAMGREAAPSDREALGALIQKYTTDRGQ